MAQRPRAAGPSVLTSLVFSIVTTSLVLGALELGARFYERARLATLPTSPVIMDPVLHHRLRPSTTSYDRERGITVSTNAQGWVEPYDVSKEKPPGVYRIFYVGDSTTQGLVAFDAKMTTLVERELNRVYEAQGRKIEVINAGTSSYSVMIYYLLVKTVLLDYAPDLVVIDVDMTDVPDDFSYRRYAVLDANGIVTAFNPALEPYAATTPFGEIEVSGLQRLKMAVCRVSAVARLVDQAAVRLLPAPPHADLADVEARVKDHSANWLGKEWNAELEANVGISMRYLGMTLDLLHSRGVRALVTGVPNYGQFAGTYSIRPHATLAATAAAHQTPFLDSYAALAPTLSGSVQTDYYWSFDPFHFNEKGNALWAKAQVDFLLAHRDQLLP